MKKYRYTERYFSIFSPRDVPLALKFILPILAAAVFIPLSAYGATYYYVDTSGEVRATEASSPALAIATAIDIHPNSGVALDNGTLEAGMDIDEDGSVGGMGGGDVANTTTYQYVDIYGQVRYVEASSPEDALLRATLRAKHSGVIYAEVNPIENVGTIESV